jgi:DNA-binding response OmpR family regulator
VAPEIFVVDNESDIRRLVKVCLEAAVFEVRTAANGTEMRRLFADRAPDLVLLD